MPRFARVVVPGCRIMTLTVETAGMMCSFLMRTPSLHPARPGVFGSPRRTMTTSAPPCVPTRIPVGRPALTNLSPNSILMRVPLGRPFPLRKSFRRMRKISPEWAIGDTGSCPLFSQIPPVRLENLGILPIFKSSKARCLQ